MGYVLVPKNLNESLTTDEHDDRPWTSEKRDVLGWEAAPWTIGDHRLINQSPWTQTELSQSEYRRWESNPHGVTPRGF